MLKKLQEPERSTRASLTQIDPKINLNIFNNDNIYTPDLRLINGYTQILIRPENSGEKAPHSMTLKPFHERLRNYIKIRSRLFSDSKLGPEIVKKYKRSTVRLRNFYRKVKSSQKNIVSTIINSETDGRLYTEIKILNRLEMGLLDSGANVSCIGKDLAMQDFSFLSGFRKIKSSVRTADGSSQEVIGLVGIEIFHRNQTRKITFYIVPSLNQRVILGLDFWRAFGLINSLTLYENGNPNIFTLDFEDPDRFPLTPQQQQQIEIVKTLYPSFEKQGLCLDARKINSVTLKDAYPLPNIEGIFARLPKANIISKIDLKDAYWQVPLDEKSKAITAFTIPGRPLYQSTVMPFGLCNAPQTMCRLINEIIPAELRNCVFGYLDDICVVSDSFDSHLAVLMKLADALTKANLTLNINKSKFCVRKVKYLGYIIGDGGISTDPEKIESIINWPTPKTMKQVRGFLGLTGWYRRFISNFADITHPISAMLCKKKKFEWTDDAETAFKRIKELLTILKNPDFSKKILRPM